MAHLVRTVHNLVVLIVKIMMSASRQMALVRMVATLVMKRKTNLAKQVSYNKPLLMNGYNHTCYIDAYANILRILLVNLAIEWASINNLFSFVLF